MDLVFVHGWGSGPFVWKDMIDEFSDHSCHVVNLGFLGEENIEMPVGKFIGIGHSLGGLWLMKHYPEQMVGFISIASFNNFYKYMPKHILNSMRRNIAKETSTQLKEFWHHAGLDHKGGFKNLKPLQLIEGLTWLSKWKSYIPEDIPLKILACRDDHIVPAKMSERIWSDYDIEWIEEGGHMLPLTQSNWCVNQVMSFIDAIE